MDQPCRNPQCKSVGQIHPHCACYAAGGMVKECSGSHLPECAYYADGGAVQAPLEASEDPMAMIGHAAVEHGLSGLLKQVGRPGRMIEPEKHHALIQDAKNQHEWRTEPKDLKLPKTMGTKLGDHLFEKNHDGASEHLHGHPLVGGAGKTHLKPIMQRMDGPLMAKEPHPEAFRGSVDYLHNSLKGKNSLESSVRGLFSSNAQNVKHEPKQSREALKKAIQEFDENPEALLDLGGSLGHYLPEHQSALAATSAQALDYLKSIQPKPTQNAPLDKIAKVSPAEEAQFDRQLDLAEKPTLLLEKVKRGTLIPQDLKTVQSIYPKLFDEITAKAGEALIGEESKKKAIPYTQRMSLSMLLGQPLDSTMTPMSLQAVMKANAGADTQKKQEQQKSQKASAAELKQIDKVDSLYKTREEVRETAKRN